MKHIKKPNITFLSYIIIFLPFLSEEWLTVRIIGCPPKGIGIVKWISGSDRERFPAEKDEIAAAFD